MNEEFIKHLFRSAIQAQVEKMNSDLQKIVPIAPGTDEHRQYLEYHHSIETTVTDKDMLLIHIDMALDEGNIDLFEQLTNELKGVGSV